MRDVGEIVRQELWIVIPAILGLFCLLALICSLMQLALLYFHEIDGEKNDQEKRPEHGGADRDGDR